MEERHDLSAAAVLQKFLAVVRPFEQDTGITVDFTGMRDLMEIGTDPRHDES